MVLTDPSRADQSGESTWCLSENKGQSAAQVGGGETNLKKGVRDVILSYVLREESWEKVPSQLL